jgi:hypothetical protein
MTEFDPYAEPVEEVEAVVEVAAEDDETPPDPGFLIQKDFYGKGTERVALSSGQAVGLWLDEPERKSLSGEDVRTLLLGMGLDEARANWFGGHRAKAQEAVAALAATPAMQAFAESERQTEDRVSMVRQAFLKRQAEGKGKL